MQQHDPNSPPPLPQEPHSYRPIASSTAAPPPPAPPVPEPDRFRADTPPASSGILTGVLVLCCLLLGILLSWGLHHRRASQGLHSQYQALAHDYALLRARHDELGQLMANPRMQWLPMQPENDARIAAAVAWNPARRDGALFLSGLAPLSDGQQYQLWLDGPDRPAVSAAVFDAPRGGAVHLLRPALPINDIHRFVITVEPAEGSPEPSGQPVASAELP